VGRGSIAGALRPVYGRVSGRVIAFEPYVVTLVGLASEMGRPPDWIRMDVQGFEFDVLEGATFVLREARGRLRIVAETHPDLWPAYGIQPSEASERLARFRLQARSLEPGRNPFTESVHLLLEPMR
jgi:hypothetical protein